MTEIDDDNEGDQHEKDDALMVCRCETPKLLVDLLQSFSKNGGWSRNSNGSGTYSGGNSSKVGGSGSGSGGATQASQRLVDGSSSTNKLHPMTVFCTRNGLTIHSQSSNKQFQASMELPATLFSYFRLMSPPDSNNRKNKKDANNKDTGNGNNDDDDDDDDISHDFTIHWQTFMQCLNVLMIGTGGDKIHASSYNSSSLTMSYHTSTEVLRLEWEGGHRMSGGSSTVVATAAVPGLNPPPAEEAAELSLAFGQSPIRARWLCPSARHELSDAKELDYVPGATTVLVRFLRRGEGTDENENNCTINGPTLRLSTRGHSGRVKIDIPASIEFSIDSNHVQGEGDNNANKIAYTYSLAGWRQALQPLELARETCLSVNNAGILAIQHQLLIDLESSNNLYQKKKMKRKSYQDQATAPPPPPPSSMESAFCDFLLLPLEMDDNDDSDDDTDGIVNFEHDDSDDAGNDLTPSSFQDTDRYTQRSSSSVSQKTNNNGEYDEEQSITQTQSQARGRSRRQQHILSQSQRSEIGCEKTSGDDDDSDNDPERLQIESDFKKNDERGNEDDEHNETVSSYRRRNILFPSVAEGENNNGAHHNQRREHRNKRRRRSSHQQSFSTMSTAGEEGEDADEDEASQRSANLLDDDDEDDDDDQSNSEQADTFSNRYNTASHRRGSCHRQRDGDDNDEDRYCSSPELVYGQQS